MKTSIVANMSSQALLGHAHPRLLKFGVEYEFLVAVWRRILDPHPEDPRWLVPLQVALAQGPNDDSANRASQDNIKSVLESNGIPVLSGYRYGFSSLGFVQREMVSQGVHLRPNLDHVAVHAFWMVKDDQSIQMIEEEDIDGYRYEVIEVASRILPETEFAEVEKVYTLIQRNIRTQVNSSCGLHCHIGIEHLSLESIKKLVTLLMVAEAGGVFWSICARHRSSPVNEHCRPVSRLSRAAMQQDSPNGSQPNFRLQYYLPPHHGISPGLLLALTRIWNCGDFNAIVEQTLTCNDGVNADSGFNTRGGFAIRRPKVMPDIEGNLVNSDPTVEFRYKESTGSALEDYHWVQLCLQLVRVAEWSGGEFRDVLGGLSTANTLDGRLRVLGVGTDEVQWWLRMAQRHQAHPTPGKKYRFLEPENVLSSGLA